MRQIRWWVLIALLVRIDVAGAAVTLRASSATVSTPGDTADLCVALSTDGEQVAGIQNDLVWDGSCATLVSESDCHINPATGKTLYGNPSAAPRLRLPRRRAVVDRPRSDRRR